MAELKTKNLQLRALHLNDANNLFKVRFNDEVTKYLDRKKPENKSELIEFIKNRLNDVESKTMFFWAICKLNNTKLIGTICLWNFNDEKTTAEIGYELHPEYHSIGFMSEAMKAVIDFGFNKLQLKNIEAFTSKYNESSKKLLHKFDFKLEENRIDNGFPNNIIYTKHHA